MARDPEIREHVMAALDSAKKVLDKGQGEGARSAASNKRVQNEVVKAAQELREGAAKLTARPHPSKKKPVAKAAAAGAPPGEEEARGQGCGRRRRRRRCCHGREAVHVEGRGRVRVDAVTDESI